MGECPNCKNKIEENVTFCSNCGINLKSNNKVINNNTKDNKYTIAIITFIVTFLVTTLSSAAICWLIISTNLKSTTINNNKNVSITDTGLAESVEKVYDAVVVVKTYIRDSLYATGTGFVFKVDDHYGYILTNHHVIEDGSNIRVVFTSNDEVDVEIVGSDEFSDVAVLKVDKAYVTCIAEMGSSKDLRVGDTAFALGAPLDAATYSWSVTRGVISGKDRVVESSNYVMEVLQTDAAINSGNSGGPLCNVNGEVIGITNMKISSSSIEGMGFAIPIEVALEYAEHFLSGTPIQRPYLGISMYDLSNNFFSRQTGIYVNGVETDGPAFKAGLQVGDVITHIDGKEVETSSYLKYELYKHKIGDVVDITFTRNGQSQTVKVTLGSYNITT